MKRRNPRFGCVRIAQQLAHAFGVDIDKDVVRRVLAKYYRPDDCGTSGPSWLTFIGDMKDGLWSVDMFRCESILLHSHWVMLVMDVCTRRLVGFGIERANIDGISVCRMFNRAIATQNVLSKSVAAIAETGLPGHHSVRKIKRHCNRIRDLASVFFREDPPRHVSRSR